MKVKLYYVLKDNWLDNELEGIYTEQEFEDLKKEIIENYRDCSYYINDIQNKIDNFIICGAALGKEEHIKKFKEEVHIIEEKTVENFISDYVDIYEKEI